MNEPYDEDEDYDDDYDHDYTKDPYKWYYQFDIGPDTPLSQWISDMLNNFINPTGKTSTDGNEWTFISNIPGFPVKKFPVNSWNPNTAKHKGFQYLGSNYQGSAIWKSQYFVIDKMQTQYKLHIQAYAKHFIQQPHYYKGMFDILN